MRIIDPEDLREASRGIYYRYFQFKNSIMVLPFSRYCLAAVYKNALVESFTINLRCLLEFFNIDPNKREYTNPNRPSSSVFVQHYFDPIKDTALHDKIKEVWINFFLGIDPDKPIKFKCKDAYTKEEKEFTVKQIIEELSSHVAHQGVWNIQISQKRGGRTSWKISDWHEEQFHPGISELVKTWYHLLKEHKPELLHDDWLKINDKDFQLEFLTFKVNKL